MRSSSLFDASLFKLGPGFWLGAFSFAVMVLFVPGLASPAVAPRWAMLAAVVPAVVMFTRCERFTVGRAAGALLLGWATLSLLWTPNIWDGLRGMAEFGILAGLFHIGAAATSLRPVFIGAGLGLTVNAVFVLLQVAGIDLVDRIPGPTGMGAGLFMNRNYLAEPAALVLIGLIAYRLWWSIPGAAICVMPMAILMPWNFGASARDLLAMPMSRGALLGLAVAGVVWLWPRSRLTVLAGASLMAGALLALLNDSTSERMVLWAATLDGMTWLGNGIGSFYTLFPSHAPGWDFLGTTRPMHAHNDWLEMTYELGIGAILWCALLWWALRQGNVERFVLAGFVTIACFGFPLHFPATVFLGGLVAGQLCRGRPALRDLLARGGMALHEMRRRVAAHLAARPACPRRWGIPARTEASDGTG